MEGTDRRTYVVEVLKQNEDCQHLPAEAIERVISNFSAQLDSRPQAERELASVQRYCASMAIWTEHQRPAA